MKNNNNYNILCFGPSDWWANNPSCCTHLMQGLSVKHRILYVNPVSSDLLGTHSRKGFLTRVIRKIKSILRFYQKVDDQIYVISPLFIPMQGIPFVDILNNIFIRFQISLVGYVIGMGNPLLWIENVRAADFIKAFQGRIVLYHVSDRFDECPYTKNKVKLRERERFITQQSNVILCVSKELYDSKKTTGKTVCYLPHGVDYEVFRSASEKKEKYKLPLDNQKPIVGYFGTLTAQNDIELLEYCASRLTDFNFVFAGQVTAGDYSRLRAMNNVHFIGKVPYSDIPRLCATFDVCVLPWKMNKWIENCNPLKLKEYFASGKPIVSVPIREVVENYSSLVSIADTKESYCEKILWEYHHDTRERREKRINIAKQHDWQIHVAMIEEIIEKEFRNSDQNG